MSACVTTDVHESAQCATVAEVCDILQIRPSCVARPICDGGGAAAQANGGTVN
jgi:3-deoxy-D-manno-octulosonic acid (KDO) 8-phosphate synthase